MEAPRANNLYVEQSMMYFPPPLTRHITNHVTVVNATNEPCVFKVHSFEPELYTVKPSAAVLAPNKVCIVQISLRKMRSEPDAGRIEELNKRQKFKIRARQVPPTIYAQVQKAARDSMPIPGGDVWKTCDQMPYAMDCTVGCDFSGTVAPGATVTFDNNDSSAPPLSARGSASGPAAAAAAGQNRAVSFSANGAAANGAAGSVPKSALKSQGGAGSSDVGTAESAAIRENTSAKGAIEASVADHERRKAALEREIQEKMALLASLANTDAAAAAKEGAGAGGKKKKKGLMGKGINLSVVLMLVIAFYVLGSFARAHVGHEHVSRYIESIVPADVRAAAASSKAAVDGAVAGSFASFAATGVPAAEAPAVAAKAAEAEIAEAVVPDAAVEPAAEAPAAAAAASDAAAPPAGGEKKKKVRRRKKVVKADA